MGLSFSIIGALARAWYREGSQASVVDRDAQASRTGKAESPKAEAVGLGEHEEHPKARGLKQRKSRKAWKLERKAAKASRCKKEIEMSAHADEAAKRNVHACELESLKCEVARLRSVLALMHTQLTKLCDNTVVHLPVSQHAEELRQSEAIATPLPCASIDFYQGCFGQECPVVPEGPTRSSDEGVQKHTASGGGLPSAACKGASTLDRQAPASSFSCSIASSDADSAVAPPALVVPATPAPSPSPSAAGVASDRPLVSPKKLLFDANLKEAVQNIFEAGNQRTERPCWVASSRLVAEEADESYKDVTAVVRTCHEAGISRLVVRLRPLAVIKG